MLINCIIIYFSNKKQMINFISPEDLDVDNQTDGGTLVMSGPDTDSESDVPDALESEEFPETSYIHCAEEEFGAVSILKFYFEKVTL